jgi:hypothetical protein
MSLDSDRKAASTKLESDRRAIGNQITADLNRLVNPTKKTQTLSVIAKRGGVAAQTGIGTYDPKNEPSSGGGVSSPLTEPEYAKRVYWENRLLSSDGLFSMPVIKQLVLQDADGAPVVINLADPMPTATP